MADPYLRSSLPSCCQVWVSPRPMRGEESRSRRRRHGRIPHLLTERASRPAPAYRRSADRRFVPALPAPCSISFTRGAEPKTVHQRTLTCCATLSRNSDSHMCCYAPVHMYAYSPNTRLASCRFQSSLIACSISSELVMSKRVLRIATRSRI